MTITSEMEPADMEMMTDIPEDTGSPVGLIVAVIVGVAAVAAVVTAVLLKRRKKKIQELQTK